ncbi:hypothetical protein [Algirhabdus cladophorae]|uniref:hypothetical protein n=1 Tax=Algirhabdus cladophorae TaxID=3377108 RepID=UPI003B84AC31
MKDVATQMLERPHLTMPAAEADWLRSAYEAADVILEYGSGGSTVMAGEMAGKTVFSVENDAAWADKMEAWFAAHPAKADLRIVRQDTGKTREWAMPDNTKKWRKFASYPLEVWTEPDFVQPDVVLVDGRFRAGCLLACLYMTEKPITVYFDDYRRRTIYHSVEDFVKPTEIQGRMARFDIEPTTIPRRDLLTIINLLQRPR